MSSEKTKIAQSSVALYASRVITGMTFTVGLVFGVILPGATLLISLSPLPDQVSIFSNTWFSTPVVLQGAAVVFVFVSLIAGIIFWQKDIRVPDVISFKKSTLKTTNEGPARQDDDGSPAEVDYPYKYLKEYLEERGMNHLADLVPWSGNDESTHSKRSKQFINSLKVKLYLNYPESYNMISRNESHIRFMAALWYVGRSIFSLCFLGVFFGLSLIFINLSNGAGNYLSAIISLCSAALTLVASVFLYRVIEQGLHYQRIREILYILEATYMTSNGLTAKRDGLIDA